MTRRSRRAAGAGARTAARAAGLALAALLAPPALPDRLEPLPAVAAQATVVHGADSVFATGGVAIAWAVLRAPVEDETEVVVRIAAREGSYAWVSVDAVDPFSGIRQPVLLAQPLRGPLDVRGRRALFAAHPRREIHFFRDADERRAGRPALTVYYLGVPDTTPEFTSEPALQGYLAGAVARAAAGSRAP